jgi:putative toxin-antitoxin system antitoxin component (TIGR02293 family)
MNLAVLDALYRAPAALQVARLNAGFPASVFSALAEHIDLSVEALALALDLSPRTLRNRSGKLSADEAERSFRVYRVYRRAEEVLGDTEDAKAWMSTPQRVFGRQTPLSLLVRDVGAEEVLNALMAIDHGVYL